MLNRNMFCLIILFSAPIIAMDLPLKTNRPPKSSVSKRDLCCPPADESGPDSDFYDKPDLQIREMLLTADNNIIFTTFSVEVLCDILLKIGNKEPRYKQKIHKAILAYTIFGFPNGKPSQSAIIKLIRLCELVGNDITKEHLSEFLWNYFSPHKFNWHKYSALQIASAITVRDERILQELSTDEVEKYMNQNRPHVIADKIIEYLDNTTNFFAFEIARQKNEVQRAELASKLLEVGIELKKLGNAFGASQIVCALAKRSIADLCVFNTIIWDELNDFVINFHKHQNIQIPPMHTLLARFNNMQTEDLSMAKIADSLKQLHQYKKKCSTNYIDLSNQRVLVEFFSSIEFRSDNSVDELFSIRINEVQKAEPKELALEKWTCANLAYFFGSYGKMELWEQLIKAGFEDGAQILNLCRPYSKAEGAQLLSLILKIDEELAFNLLSGIVGNNYLNKNSTVESRIRNFSKSTSTSCNDRAQEYRTPRRKKSLFYTKRTGTPPSIEALEESNK